jgi:hypothetical protein
VAQGRLANAVWPVEAAADNERLALHLWKHRDQLFTFPRQPGLDATNGPAEPAVPFVVMLR